ncbi:MAG: ATP phosphoribosyltransferase [Dehalococcoidia bacterium]|nr:ATP phosphoribosyltransferase [Dehalococcoidia bacterium]
MIKLALPAGDLRTPVAGILGAAGLNVEGYGEGSRTYILSVGGREEVVARVFREKDIPIQIALGSYDLGVCGMAWVEELRARFPHHPVVPLRDLGVGRSALYVASAADGGQTLASLGRRGLRIASEYPNVAEAFALAARLPAYRVLAVWGAAEAYPPEDADLAVIAAADEAAVSGHGLSPLLCLMESSAWLIANAESLAKKELRSALEPLASGAAGAATPRLRLPPPLATASASAGPAPRNADMVRMALPDGHQQRHAVAALREAGLLPPQGYDESQCLRRPVSPLPGLEFKVIRPHDMPQLVATGEIDLAVTGRDCLTEHLSRFPSSPVEEVADLQRGQFDLAAVASEAVPASDLSGALEHWHAEGRQVIRVASEFPGIADAYARSRHLGRYRVIPIAGASEGFVPADAELLIEGTETGRTLAENKLKAIDLLFRSTTCLIAGKDRGLRGRRRDVFEQVVRAMQQAANARQAV